jgi:glyoxylase-like metal-dependent hydrolase (beta-lactamase superfamily II)
MNLAKITSGTRYLTLAALAATGAGALWLTPQRELSAQNGATAVRHKMTRITDTIYRADNPGTPGINATSWVFLNDEDVLVTDSEGSPASARSLIEGVKSITSKPVKYLVDTHFHIDHAYGNAGLPATIQVIGHEFTRKSLLGPEARQGITFTNFTAPMPSRIEALKKQIAVEGDPQKKQALEQQLSSQQATLAAYTGDFPLSPPNLTVKKEMSVWSGKKEFRIMWMGRAHTAGDLVVYVPSERAAASGDIVFKGMIGWQGDSFPNEQPGTIDAIGALDLELLLPAHGESIQGGAAIREAMSTAKGYLREEWKQVSDLKKQGLTPEQALARVDMGEFKKDYGNGAAANLTIVRRMFNLIDGQVAIDQQ